MRLFLVIDGFYPWPGGTESQVALLARLFRQRGHEVRIIAPRLDPGKPLEEIVDGTRVTRIDYPKIKGLGAVFLILRFMLFLLSERKNFDALHVHMAKNLAAAAGAVRRWLPGPVLVKVSGAWEFDGGVLDERMRWHPVYTTLRWLMRRVDAFQAISVETERRLLASGMPVEKVKAIPNAVDLSLYGSRAFDASRKMLRVVYTGRLTPVKGVDVLLRAWNEISPGGRFELNIVGDGPQRAEMEAYVADQRLTGSVRFSGWTDDVRSALRDADLYVQPSLNEGLPNSVLEAMAASLPIVATRVSGNEDLVVEGVNGFLAQAGDSSSLAAAMVRALADAEQMHRMGQASRRLIESRYGSERVLDQLEAVYAGAS
ncbi:MAG: glycosyltransferase family 4 protein [Burkholderiaceae bacterium]